jgi:DNA-binding NtrC family response regulator
MLQGPRPADGPAAGPASLVGRPLAEVERYYIEQALQLAGGNREKAARMLGISERKRPEIALVSAGAELAGLTDQNVD